MRSELSHAIGRSAGKRVARELKEQTIAENLKTAMGTEKFERLLAGKSNISAMSYEMPNDTFSKTEVPVAVIENVARFNESTASAGERALAEKLRQAMGTEKFNRLLGGKANISAMDDTTTAHDSLLNY